MSVRRALASGDLLAGRYELHDLVNEKLGAATWRAQDQSLHRNVGVELLPSDDPRAAAFLDAARLSTQVIDPRFLRVLDLIEGDHGHHIVVREWARAFPLDRLLQQSPLPNRRAATVIADVAEAMAHAHERGVHHRRLTPHQVLLKQSGAVRLVGLGVAEALDPDDEAAGPADPHRYELEDVEGIGRLLYACLTGRWPGRAVDGLRDAPTDHGRLLRPRQVRAGVSRDIDTVCDRILGDPPRHHETPLRKAALIGRTVRLAGEDVETFDDQPSLAGVSSPDLLRLDPVIEPAGPPPGLEPPRRRPKAHQPPPPTAMERAVERGKRATRGDRALVLAGVVGALLIASTLAFIVGRSLDGDGPSADPIDDSSPVRTLPIRSVDDFDPGGDDQENPDQVDLAIDGDVKTGWQTTRYIGRPDLGGLKNGVGLVVDLGGLREVTSVRLRLGGEPTDLSILVGDRERTEPPDERRDVKRVTRVEDSGPDATISLPADTTTRFLVIWLQRVPEAEPGAYRGEIREISVRGRS